MWTMAPRMATAEKEADVHGTQIDIKVNNCLFDHLVNRLLKS
jgi:hypothetical protein